MIIFGNISEVDAQKGRYRVDLDGYGIVSPWMQRVLINTKGTKDEACFVVGEHIACVMDEHLEQGVILGAIYDANNLPDAGDKNLRRVKFSDGSILEFDIASGNYRIQTEGKTTIDADEIDLESATFIKLMGNVDRLVRHAALNTALQTSISQLNTVLANISTVLNGLAPGSFPTPPFVQLDITAAKIDELKCP